MILRGKAHVEWKVMLSGERRTVKDDQYFIDDRQVIWGEKNITTTIPILPRGVHKFPFRFSLPESSLPCSFESKPCCIRYYIKVTVDIPYASPPEGVKYFTIIGPHIDCMEEQYLVLLFYIQGVYILTSFDFFLYSRNPKYKKTVKAPVVGVVNVELLAYAVYWNALHMSVGKV